MINFVFPQFLWALLALSIPIVIHLFHFKRFKKVLFSNVSFLKDIQITTQNKREIKRWLVLAARCLALIFLVLAFTQPFIPKNNNTSTGKYRAISIYIDNSFSMNADSKDGNLLLIARQKAKEIVKGFKDSDKFQILTNNFEGRHQHLISKEECLLWIDEIKPTSVTRSITDVQNRQAQALNQSNDPNKLAFILSDFQTSILKNYQNLADTTIQTTWVPLNSSNKKNIAIDSCYFETPYIKLNATNKLIVKIKNYGEEAIENGSISLYINGQQKTVGGFTVNANSSIETILSFTINQSGWQKCELSIVDNPITFDDKLYFSFQANAEAKVYVINGISNNSFINNVYATDPYFNVSNTSINQIDYSQLKKSGLIILNEIETYQTGLSNELKEYITNGGDAIFFPSSKVENLDNLNQFLNIFDITATEVYNQKETVCDKLNLQSLIYKDAFENTKTSLDLPKVYKYVSYSFSKKYITEPLLTLKNNKLLISMIKFGKGKLYISAVPLQPDFSNFQNHATFVPFMLKSAMASSEMQPLFYRINTDKYIYLDKEINKTEQGIKLVKTNFEMIPEINVANGNSRLFLSDAIKESGNYELLTKDNNHPIISFNYDSDESNTTYISENELSKMAGSNIQVSNIDKVDKRILAFDGNKYLWRYCILLAIFFVFLEILLIKLLK